MTANRTKICGGCGEQPWSAFGVDRSTSDGLRSKCKTCRKKAGSDYFNKLSEKEKEKRRERTRQWRRKHPDKYRASYINSERKRRYGIDAETYQQMLEKQNHRCVICKREEKVRSNGKSVDNLPVDHDHISGKVRELLCHGCNKIIAFANDNPELLEAAAAYLRKHNRT
jgi:Recombination endonuclease VII